MVWRQISTVLSAIKKKKREKYNDEGRIYLNSPQQLSKISGRLSFIYIAFIVK